ncbi:monooxygenase 1-like isoform X2 [Miscanthus floridulus]|uniref:monooxygenase 1-like isoform X2 n=1 Tax=Miscanthus floridulus TaxID=154761 RepID=UPI0034580E13
MEEEAHGIIIVGGGIVGLATALALHRKGIASLVLEKSETLRADGVAIGVHANGWRVLEQLGVAAELRETANLITAYHDVWQQRNNKTSQLPIRLVQQVWQRRNKTSQLPIRKELRNLKRKDLIETMAKNLPSGAIRFGCHVVAIHQDHGTHGAILTTVDGCTIKAKVLIGCDGANSVVAKYLGLSAPKTIHRTVFRGFTRYPHGHPFSTEFLRLKGDEFFVGRIPITHNLVQSLVITPIPPTGRITKDVIATKDSVVEKLRAEDCPSDVIEMLRNSDPETLNVVNNIWYRPPWQVAFGTFHKGVVTVAGDAMHVMGPFIGQGGSSGLEDAVVLARSLSRAAAGDYSVAIEEYVRERRPRVALVSLESFVFGMLGSAKSLVTKLACIVFLALLGNRSFRHANYDCGRL